MRASGRRAAAAAEALLRPLQWALSCVTAAVLIRAHVPTGAVTLQQVLRFAIEGLGVRPLRDDWREVLASPPGESLV